MNSFADEAVKSSNDDDSVNVSLDESIKECESEHPNHLHLDFGQASCCTSSYDAEVPSSSAPVKRKLSSSGVRIGAEESSTTSQSSSRFVSKIMKIDTEGVNNDRQVEESKPKTAEELEEQADEDDENYSSSCSDDNSDGEVHELEEPSDDAVRDDRRSCCTSQASADEDSSSSSYTSASSQSSEDCELNEEDNNNNHSGNDITVSDDSDDESESSDDGKSESPERIPQVLNKTLPKQNFNLLKEIFNRQFQDNFKRKRRMKFENKIYASSKMVQRLELFKTLDKHRGCVNSIFFNDTGEVLVSASDDHHVCLWDWTNYKSRLYFDTGHVANVFQAKFLPCTNDTHLVTCGADSQIRMSLLDPSGLRSTSLIVEHERTVHKIALQRQMPNTFLSAGEDGVVFLVDIREPNHFTHKLLTVVNTRSKSNSPIFLFSIDCNPSRNNEFIVCGYDKNIRLYDQRRISPNDLEPVKIYCPTSLKSSPDQYRAFLSKKHVESVTSAVFNYNGTEILGSYSDNDIYLFDSNTSEEVHRYDGHRNFASIKGVNFYGPHSEYIVSGSDCGHIYLWDKNSEAIVQWMKGDDQIVNCLEPHPLFPILATSGMESNVKIWMPTGKGDLDIRDSSDFQKVTRKNYCYGLFGLSGNSRRWADLRSSFIINSSASAEMARNILSTHIAADLMRGTLGLFNNDDQWLSSDGEVWSYSEDQNDGSSESATDSD